MKKKQSTLSKFDWAALTALLFVLVYEAPSERIFLSVIIFASYWVSEWFWRASHRKIAPAFHLPAILVIALTVAEASKMLCPWLENMEVAFIAVPVIWLSLSSPRLDQRLESSCIFLIFSETRRENSQAERAGDTFIFYKRFCFARSRMVNHSRNGCV